MLPSAPAKLLEGKKGLIVGIANDQSIAWGCAVSRGSMLPSIMHGAVDSASTGWAM